MTWFMMFVSDNLAQTRNGFQRAFKAVTRTGGSGDGGRDVVCTSFDESRIVILNCKNEASNRGHDLLHTVESKLRHSTYEAPKYHVAIAAQHPKFTVNEGETAVQKAAKLTVRLERLEPGLRLSVLEWEGPDGIEAQLTDALNANPVLYHALHDRLLDDFELTEEGQPKEFDNASYVRRLRAARHL